MKRIFIGVLVFSSAFCVWAEEKQLDVVVVNNPKDKDVVAEFFVKMEKNASQSMREATFSQGASLYSQNGLSVGVQGASRLLSNDEILHDPSKFESVANGVGRWHETKFSTKVAYGAALSLPSIPLASIGLNIGLGVSSGDEEEITLITPTKFEVDPRETYWDSAIEKAKQIYGSVIHLQIPLSMKEMKNKFDQGVQLKIKGQRSFLTNLGGSISYLPMNLSGGLYATINGTFEKSLHFLEKNIVLFELKNVQSKSTGAGMSASMGMNLYQTQYAKVGLNVNFLSTSVSASQNNEVIFRYIVDLNVEQAVKALDRAWGDDLTAIQALAKGRNEANDRYEGVFIDYEKNNTLIQAAQSSMSSLDIGDSFFDYIYGSIKYRDSSYPSPFYFSSSSSAAQFSENTKNFFKENENVQKFSYSNDQNLDLLFGWASKAKKNVNVISEVKKASYVLEGESYDEDISGGEATFDVMKLSVSYGVEHSGSGAKENFNSALTSLRSVFMHYDPQLMGVLDKFEKQNCQTAIKFNVNGTFYEEAIDQILTYQTTESWAMFGKFLGLAKPAVLRYEKTRKEFLEGKRAEIFKDDMTANWMQKINGIGSSMSRDENMLRQDLRTKRKLVSSIERYEQTFIPLWEKLLKTKDRASKMKLLKDLFEAYKNDELTVLTILSMKAGGESRRGSFQDSFKGSFIQYKVDGGDCQLQYSKTSDLMFRLGDVVRDWQ